MPRDPREIVVRNLLTIQRYGNALNADVRDRINELFEEVVAVLAKIDPTGPSLQRYRIQRAEQLFDEIQKLAGESFDEIHRHIRVELARFGKQQGETAIAHLRAIIGAGAAGKIDPVRVTLNQMKAIIDTDPLQGAHLKDWTKRQGEQVAFRVRREIQLGMTRAETIDEMTRRVRGRHVGRGRYVGGVLGTTEREAEALVRTAVNDVSNVAAQRTYQENQDVTTTYEYTATLDGRTTLICASLDGRRFRYDDPKAPKPPQHWNCRSFTTPVIDWDALGVEPPPVGTRASAGGQTPADTNYEEWLRQQPAALQDDILGPGRAKLFRQGRVTLREMVKSDGRIVRLDELERAA